MSASPSPGPMHMPVQTPSPCINVCRMHEASGLCEGCLRTIDEIAAWSALDDAAKRAVWDAIETRHAQWMQHDTAKEGDAR